MRVLLGIRMVPRRTLLWGAIGARTAGLGPSRLFDRGAAQLQSSAAFLQNSAALVYHTDANGEVVPPNGSTIVVTQSRVNSLGRLSYVDLNSKVVIDGVE